MTIQKISSARLENVFAGLAKERNTAKAEVNKQADQAPIAPTEAVKLAKDFGSSSTKNAERVAELKNLVSAGRAGEYFKQVDLKEVARSVIVGLMG